MGSIKIICGDRASGKTRKAKEMIQGADAVWVDSFKLKSPFWAQEINENTKVVVIDNLVESKDFRFLYEIRSICIADKMKIDRPCKERLTIPAPDFILIFDELNLFVYNDLLKTRLVSVIEISKFPVKLGDKPYFIWNGQYIGNSLVFWRKGKSGYTTNIEEAQQFTLEEAKSICYPETHHSFISASHCREKATLQLNADAVDRELFGEEVSNG